MNWIEAKQAINDARQTISSADGIANDCADILCGRLRKVSHWKLAKLKRELFALSRCLERERDGLLEALDHLQANPNDPRCHRRALDAIAKAKGEK